MPVTSAIAQAATEPAQANRASRVRLRPDRSATAPTTGSTSAESSVVTVIAYSASDPGATGTPSTCRSVRQARSVSCPGQAARLATTVR